MNRAGLLLPLTIYFMAAGHLSAQSVRPYLEGGPWYPADPGQLDKMVSGMIATAKAPPQLPGTIQGIIAPHAGFAYSGLCAAAGYRVLSGRSAGIRRVIVMGTAHRGGFSGVCTTDFDYFATPLGRIPVDGDACRQLARMPLFTSSRSLMAAEHSIENQLPFLQKVLSPGFSLVPLLFSRLEENDLAAVAGAVASLVDDHTLLVASSDLTHYGDSFAYTPFRDNLRENLTRLDMGLVEPMLRLDYRSVFRYWRKTGITACGIQPIGVLLRVLAGKKCRGYLADYSKSGDMTGDYRLSVSYAAVLFSCAEPPGSRPRPPTAVSPAEKATLLAIARDTLAAVASGRTAPDPADGRYPKTTALERNAGVFVTLRRYGELRGCIGSLVGAEPLFRGVAQNTVHAALHDPRFPPVAPSELNQIRIEISVMTPLQPAPGFRSIRLGRDGVVIRDGRHQAVFLPQVATETGWDLDEFMSQLCRKAGLPRDAYRNSPSMTVHLFQADVFGEPE